MMERRKLGDLEVSAMGLGCMGFTHAYGAPMDEKEAERRIREAYDIGYTFFDSAECYQGIMPDGRVTYNEDVVGNALKDIRNHVQIATKFGITIAPDKSLVPDSRKDVIRKSVEDSLKRLKTDHIDLYYQHRIDKNIPAEEVAETMNELMKEGKILHWGISETDEEYLRKANRVSHVTAVQNRYSMMARDTEKLFPVLEELGIGLVAFSPLANGFLTGLIHKNTQDDRDYRNSLPQFTKEGYESGRVLLELLTTMSRERRITIPQLSLAWMMSKRPYIVPIPGTREPERMRENANAADVKLTKDEIDKIDNALSLMTFIVFKGHGSRQ